MELLDVYNVGCGGDLTSEIMYGYFSKQLSEKCSSTNSLRFQDFDYRETIIDISTYTSTTFSMTMKDVHSKSVLFESSVKISSPRQECDDYVVICKNDNCNCLSNASISDRRNNNGLNNHCSISQYGVDTETCKTCASTNESSKQIVTVKPTVRKPKIVTSTPVQRRSVPKRGLLPSKRQHIDSLETFNSSNPKFCSTPVTCETVSGHFSFNNVSSIFEELLDADSDISCEDVCSDSHSVNMYNKSDSNLLSSRYYSVSVSSSSDFVDSDVSFECHKLKKVIQKPLNCSSIENLLDETQTVQQALMRYRKELDISEAKFNLSHVILDDELSQQERESIAELKFLRSEVRKEIELMEDQLEYRKESLNMGNPNFNPLACLEVVDKMMELLHV